MSSCPEVSVVRATETSTKALFCFFFQLHGYIYSFTMKTDTH